MRVHVVSDVHAHAEALRAAADGADLLVCLGDLVLFVDYDDHRQGLFPELFGVAAASQLVTLRSAGRFEEARRLSTRLWAELGGDRAEHIERSVRRQYAEMFAAFPRPTYLTYGNVDIPELVDQYAGDGVRVLDGEVVDIGGRSCGFVGGGLVTRYRTPYELSEEEYAAKLERVAGADVIFCHIPPAVPQLLYDVRARRLERGSVALLDVVRRTGPQAVYFGHVHNPLTRRTRLGRTECVNVGHFRGSGEAFALEW